MKTKIFFLLGFICFFSCQKKTENQSFKEKNKISNHVNYSATKKEIHLQSNEFHYKILKSKLPYQRVILLNASLVGYISALNLENKIVGITSPPYIYSEKIHRLIAQGKIKNVGNDQKYDIEKILSLKPDVILTNHIPNFENTYDILQKNGIEIIFLNEYKEQKPLEKARYLSLFGLLLGKEKKADSLYQVIEKNYHQWTAKAKSTEKSPIVLTNEMYGNQWYMSGGKTQLANYLKDANANYILKDNPEEKAIPMSFEEVFVLAQNANFWVNIASHHTKKSLLAVNPNYKELNVYQHGKIFNINKRTKRNSNDYFESGVVRVDWVLKDYIKIFHPTLFPNDSLTYLTELK